MSSGVELAKSAGKHRRGALAATLLLSTAISAAFIPVSLSTQEAVAQTGGAQSQSFNIAPQPLANALRQFADQSGMQLAYRTDDLRGINSPGIRDSATSTQALARILVGTGASYSVTSPNTITVQRQSQAVAGAAPDGTIALDTIDVRGSADGTVGYVATQSTAGTKTNTPLIETPQTINVVTRAQIADQNAQSISGALRYTPGVVAEPYGGIGTTGTPLIIIRGFTTNAGDFYLNGLKQLSPIGLDPYLLDRIEVIKGPASVLYGQASPGGLVNVASKLPTGQAFREIELSAGSPGRIQGAFDLGGPIDKDGQFLYRLTGVGLDAATSVDYLDQQRIAIAPSFSWRPDADTNLTIYGIYQNDPKVAIYNPLPAIGTILPNPNGRIARGRFIGEPSFNDNNSTVARIGYNFERRFNENILFSSSAAYTNTKINLELYNISSLNSPTMDTISRYNTQQHYRYDTFTADNRLQFDVATGQFQHKILIGTDYQSTKYDLSYGYGFNAPDLNLFNPVYSGGVIIPSIDTATRQDSTQVGLYAQDQVKFDRLTFLLGGRYDWADSKTKDLLSNATTADQNDSAFTWRTGLIYNFDNGLAPYASYSTSFQPQAGVDFSQNPFKPTTAQQYEVGLKYQPPGHDSYITVSGFQITQQNLPTTDPDHPQFQTQLGEVRSRGIEVAATMRVNEAFSLVGGYTYNDAVTTKSNTGLTGKTPTAMPKHMASLWGNYTLQDGVLRGLGFGLGVRYVGDTYGDAANTLDVPAYTLVDAALHYDASALGDRWKGLKLAVNVSNLFDKVYVPSCVFENYCSYGPGRTVTARLTYRW